MDVDELREQLKDYYGTAAIVLGDGNPFGCMGVLGEMLDIDDLSEEEVIKKASELGII